MGAKDPFNGGAWKFTSSTNSWHQSGVLCREIKHDIESLKWILWCNLGEHLDMVENKDCISPRFTWENIFHATFKTSDLRRNIRSVGEMDNIYIIG